MDVRCKKTSCKFNKGTTCMAKQLNIGNTTQCESFRFGGVEKDMSAKMFEAAPEFANSRHIKDVNLCCHKIHCLFNENNKCNANGITVLNENNKPMCGTFIKK